MRYGSIEITTIIITIISQQSTGTHCLTSACLGLIHFNDHKGQISTRILDTLGEGADGWQSLQVTLATITADQASAHSWEQEESAFMTEAAL